MLLSFLTTDAAAAPAGMGSGWVLIMYVVIIGAMFYFMAIRPQKKQQKQMDALMASLEIGDSVLTTGGFYGNIIDIMDEVVVVEFGSNRNCRIPMKKTAIVEVAKPNSEGSAK